MSHLLLHNPRLSVLPLPLPFLLPQSLQQHRHESTARRTTKRLRTKPSSTSLTASIPPQTHNDHIVFNPPTSSPSPYYTPPAFLPPNDPRRSLLSQSHHHANPYLADPTRRLPPLSHKVQKEKKYHLTPPEIEEIRRLRKEDPWLWTRKRLAEKFDCSQFFVALVAEAGEAKKAEERRALEDVKERWGRRRTAAREDRAKRREMWGMDR